METVFSEPRFVGLDELGGAPYEVQGGRNGLHPCLEGVGILSGHRAPWLKRS